mmetsp:Transcript_142192/g.247849  ORF Transcript_142192/g.247849 Transcript_142192/m.247849 type:complete len:189 (+) Transcript_142192:75-641(+)
MPSRARSFVVLLASWVANTYALEPKDVCQAQAKAELEELAKLGEPATYTHASWLYGHFATYSPENGISDCMIECNENEECCHWWFDCENGVGTCNHHGCDGMDGDHGDTYKFLGEAANLKARIAKHLENDRLEKEAQENATKEAALKAEAELQSALAAAAAKAAANVNKSRAKKSARRLEAAAQTPDL